MTAEDFTWHSDERRKEDAVTILKELFATRYRRMREAHVCKFLIVDMPGLCLNAISGLSRGLHRLRYCCHVAFLQSTRNVLLLFCIVTTTSQVHTDFHSAQHPLHRPCVSSKMRWENDGNALAD